MVLSGACCARDAMEETIRPFFRRGVPGPASVRSTRSDLSDCSLVYTSLSAVGLDFRDYAPADPSRDCHSLLQPVDGEVSMLIDVALTFS